MSRLPALCAEWTRFQHQGVTLSTFCHNHLWEHCSSFFSNTHAVSLLQYQELLVAFLNTQSLSSVEYANVLADVATKGRISLKDWALNIPWKETPVTPADNILAARGIQNVEPLRRDPRKWSVLQRLEEIWYGVPKEDQDAFFVDKFGVDNPLKEYYEATRVAYAAPSMELFRKHYGDLAMVAASTGTKVGWSLLKWDPYALACGVLWPPEDDTLYFYDHAFTILHQGKHLTDPDVLQWPNLVKAHVDPDGYNELTLPQFKEYLLYIAPRVDLAEIAQDPSYFHIWVLQQAAQVKHWSHEEIHAVKPLVAVCMDYAMEDQLPQGSSETLTHSVCTLYTRWYPELKDYVQLWFSLNGDGDMWPLDIANHFDAYRNGTLEHPLLVSGYTDFTSLA